jgi:hypothetical protein
MSKKDAERFGDRWRNTKGKSAIWERAFAIKRAIKMEDFRLRPGSKA